MISDLLSKLDRVKKTGPGRWIACCPAHQDKRPSMNIRECDDGRVLIICRAGCGAAEILDALGLDWSALMPAREFRGEDQRMAPIRKAFPDRDILKALEFETTFLYFFAKMAKAGRHPTDADFKRLELSQERISAARL